jgi:hypothetical protein
VWHEIGRIYPEDYQKKQRVYLVISALLGLVFLPLTWLLHSIQLFKFYKIKKAELKKTPEPFTQKDESIQYYAMAEILLILTTSFFLYSNYLKEARLEQRQNINVEKLVTQ